MEMHLYKALVVDIKDTDMQGKIKIKILPEMEKIEDFSLPWAIPFSSRCSSKQLSNSLPEENSTVYVLVDKYWKRFYYLSNPYFYNLFNFTTVETSLKKVKDSTKVPIDTTYQNIDFNMYEDGGIDFHNNKDGSHGFLHKSGTYYVIDKNGALVCEAPNQTITLSNAVDSLGTILEELIQDLSGLTTEGSPTSQTSPQLTAQMSLLLPKVKKLFK